MAPWGRRALRALPLITLGWQAIPAASASEATCPGSFSVKGIHRKYPDKVSDVHLVPNGWADVKGMKEVKVSENTLTPHMDSRAYFAHQCNAGKYSNKDYVSWNLLNRRLKYTVDLSGTGCGCNVAFYLVSMRQNSVESECKDYYCDANSVCGVACAEIDIMEANDHAWHTTLHTQFDHSGMGGGLGGGDGWNGPRDWSVEDYSPGGRCIDTMKPFNVSVEFPTSQSGTLLAVRVTLAQQGKPCTVYLELSEYAGMGDLTEALTEGMTPVISYWASDKMLWLDGAGTDHKGPCNRDKPSQCPPVAKVSNFWLEHMSVAAEEDELSIPAGGAVGGAGYENPNDFESPTVKPAKEATCPGQLTVEGEAFGDTVHLVPTGWGLSDMMPLIVEDGTLTATMGSRGYFATTCTAGTYDHTQYSALKLLGKTLHFSVDLSETDCGCNSALYLVSMRQNKERSDCDDYYCDANSVCGVPCAEIDIMEANKHAWHSTLHSMFDHDGQASGLGGGAGWNGPRDFTKEEFGPGGTCIDTTKPISVAASFPADNEGILTMMSVVLTQESHNCNLTLNLQHYEGNPELSAALRDGMTLVVSYWSSKEMLWLDGEGHDKKGYCKKDRPSKCGKSVSLTDFSITTFDNNVAAPTDPLLEGVCQGGRWLVPPECVSIFNYKGTVIEGCTERDSLEGAWCSHNTNYQDKFSFCKPCNVEVGDMVEPLFPLEDVVMEEDRSGQIEGEPEDVQPTDPDTGAPEVLAQPYSRCGLGFKCIEGYYCKEVNKWWSECELLDNEDPASGCVNGWKPHPSCVRTFTFDDVEYVGCTTLGFYGAGAWCATKAHYNGTWKDCTKCASTEVSAMSQAYRHFKGVDGGRPFAWHSMSVTSVCCGAAFAGLVVLAVFRMRAQGTQEHGERRRHAAMLLCEDQEIGETAE